MTEKRLVWDLPLRIFHWVLVLSLLGSWYTAEMSSKGEFIEFRGQQYGYAEVHFWLGYFALGMILFRVMWGFVGPRHARFANFLPSPGRFLTYMKTFHKRDSKPSPGHNPSGAVVVLVLLLMVGAQAVTGLFLIDNTDIFPAPYHAAVSDATSGLLMKFHHLNFEVLQWLVVLHVLAIIFYRIYKGQNLVGPMIHGHKSGEHVPPGEEAEGSHLFRALIVALIAAGIVWLILHEAPPPPSFDY